MPDGLSHLHPAILGLLEDLPEPGNPFPEKERWLDIFESILRYVYPPVPKAPKPHIEAPPAQPPKPSAEKVQEHREQRRKVSLTTAQQHEPGAPVDSAGNYKHRCPGPGDHPCGTWVSRQAKRCRSCNVEFQRHPKPAEPDEESPNLPECPCVNPDRKRCQTLAPLGIMMRGMGDSAVEHSCRLFAEEAALAKS